MMREGRQSETWRQTSHIMAMIRNCHASGEPVTGNYYNPYNQDDVEH